MDGSVRSRTLLSMPVLVGLVALVVTAVATPACITVAKHYGVIDRPGRLKTHESPVPYLGGVAVFAGLLLGEAVGHPLTLVPLAGALVLGVADDRFGLPVGFRMAAQLVVGVLVAVTVPLHLPGAIGIPFVVAVTIVLINGFNLLDGLDTLAGGVGAAAAVGFAVLRGGDARLLGASLAGALVGFLWFNRPPARIYLGDGGSYLLGAATTVLLAYSWGAGVATSIGVLALALLVVPVAEVACAVVRRRRSGRPMTAGDRRHPYDLLVARGWSPTAASTAYIGLEATIVLVVGVAVGLGSPSNSAALAIDVVAAAIVLCGAAVVGGLSPAGETCP